MMHPQVLRPRRPSGAARHRAACPKGIAAAPDSATASFGAPHSRSRVRLERRADVSERMLEGGELHARRGCSPRPHVHHPVLVHYALENQPRPAAARRSSRAADVARRPAQRSQSRAAHRHTDRDQRPRTGRSSPVSCSAANGHFALDSGRDGAARGAPRVPGRRRKIAYQPREPDIARGAPKIFADRPCAAEHRRFRWQRLAPPLVIPCRLSMSYSSS